ncbi:hypothetical protein RI507_24180, partial [Enterobacter cloacae subsp. cloacae]|nr:hypothetical protein [Enterobacter cloacae subsp. cloacae]
MKTSIINGSEVSRLSVAIHSAATTVASSVTNAVSNVTSGATSAIILAIKRAKDGGSNSVNDVTRKGVIVCCQQRVKSDPLTATTNGLILIHLVYSG